MAYSNQSQLHMLAGRAGQAIEWGRRALELAGEPDALEIRIHALNNIGAARLDAGEAAGRADLEQSLALSLAGGFEEHAARAYTNLAYGAQASRDADWLDAVLDEGIAYCDSHDLDSWSRYMQGYRSEVLLARGLWEAAVEQAEAILRAPCSAPISRIPALVVIARVRARRGDPDPDACLAQAWRLARPMGTLTRLAPVACAIAETAWLRGDMAPALPALDEAASLPAVGCNTHWHHADVCFWRWRATGEAPTRAMPEPIARHMAGDWQAAAQAWDRLGSPLEAARARAEGDSSAMREALAAFEALGARPEADTLRRRLQAAGVRGLPRGQRASTRGNPHELTARELEVLQLLCAGLRNAQIADRLRRSVRTVDHHLAAAFAKLGVGSRAEAIAAAQAVGIGPPKPPAQK
jgi:DNA-binding CsgD family transcriptional regulator